MITLKIRVPKVMKVSLFEKKMSQLIAFAEHLGLLMGGGWNADDTVQDAEFWPTAHKPGCCDKMPTIRRIDAKTKIKVKTYVEELGFRAKWS